MHSAQFVGICLGDSVRTAEMLLFQLFFVYITIHISTATINKRQTPQIDENNLQALIQGVLGSSTEPAPFTDPQPETNISPVPGQDNSGNVEECKCVPYYLCSSNKTIVEDGAGVIDIRFAGPCGNYMDVCCNEATTPPEEPYTPRPIPKISQCGQRNFDGVGFRITGAQDNEANYGEFPWMVAILRVEPVADETSNLNVYQCGGSLIHNQVVLTAAHCVFGVDPKKLKARAGEWDTQTKDEFYPYQDRNVKEVIIHENYYAAGLHNDIALLIMDTPFDRAENVDLICLPDEGEIMDGRQCAASGWGKDVFGKQGKYQVIMKKVELPIVPRALCVEELRKTRLSKFFKLHESFICAGGEPGKDTCKGDGGSPLVCPSRDNPKIYRQAGIVAWGIECGKATPGVYVNVPLFRGWITSKLSSFNIDV